MNCQNLSRDLLSKNTELAGLAKSVSVGSSRKHNIVTELSHSYWEDKSSKDPMVDCDAWRG